MYNKGWKKNCNIIAAHNKLYSVVVEYPLRVQEVLGSNLPRVKSHQRLKIVLLTKCIHLRVKPDYAAVMDCD